MNPVQYLSPLVPPLLAWYETAKRQMPWRDEPTPYHVWVSEIMLQQTRVEAVRNYYDRFISALPDVRTLAEAPEEQLLKLWEGLGYYSRARNLQKSAKIIMADYEGTLPPDVSKLRKLPGIGDYTAGAIASLAYGLPAAAVDGNVLRVLTRCLAEECDISKLKERRRLTEYIQAILPVHAPSAFNQAIMELGALVCLPNGRPRCEQCPVSFLCKAYQNGNMTAYPVKPQKNPRKIIQMTVWILQYEDKFFLEKRMEKGVLQGLWQFPNDEPNIKTADKIKQWNLQVKSIKKLPPAKHVFTHLEWHMSGQYILLKELPNLSHGVWTTCEQIQEKYSLPSAFRHYDKYLGLK